MLASRSAKAKHLAIPGKSHGIRNLPGSPSFSGNFFRRTAKQCLWLGLGALTGEATGSMIRETTGSEFKIGDLVGTTRGWMSSVLPLVDEPELGKSELDKLVLGKLEVGCDLGSCSIYILSLANGGWTIEEGMRTTTSFTVQSNCFHLVSGHVFNKIIASSGRLFMKVPPAAALMTIKPSGGMMCQGMRKEIQTKGVISDSIHFDALGDMQEFIKMLVGIITWQTMKLARILDLLNHVIVESK
nr:hypothetical protein [Tanacetum cinerariifolium]